MNDRAVRGLRRRLAHLPLVVLALAVTLAAFSHMACNQRKTSDIQADIASAEKRAAEIRKQLAEVHGSEYDASTGQFSRGYGGRGPLAITSTDLQAEKQTLIGQHNRYMASLSDLREELADAQEAESSRSSTGSDVSRRGAGAAGSVSVPTGGKPPCTGHSH
ncbi:MAG: hypothetical protein R6X20_16710 [Phycisphaerae bacterium]